MSTRTRIGILKKNGSIESIYFHLDGYPEELEEAEKEFDKMFKKNNYNYEK